MTWAEVLEEWPKLCVLKELVRGGFEARSVGVRRKKIRRILTKLGGGGGTAELQVEVGRWRGLKRKERKCTDCDSVEVEDVKYFLMRCKALNREREELIDREKEEGSDWIGRGRGREKCGKNWHAEMSSLQEKWRNCGQRGLYRSMS